MPLVGNICEMPHTLLRMCKRSVVHVYEATPKNPDFKRTNVFQVDMPSLIVASFHSSNYINIFGNLWHSCISETVVSVELLYLVWDGSPLAQLSLLNIAKKTECALHVITSFAMTFTHSCHSIMEYL